MTRGLRRRSQARWLLLLLCAACGRKNSGDTGPSASAASGAVPSSVVAAPSQPASELPARAPVPGCRAIRLSGVATVGQRSLATGDVLDGESWVTLEKGGNMALKHSVTGRELSISGPALFRACRRGREQLLLVRGSVSAASGMGSRPGAEVLIATPIGGIHYGDAEYKLDLDDKRLTLIVRAGQVEIDLEPAPQPGKASKKTLSGKDKLSLPLGKPDPKALLASCQAAAEAAQASARRVADRNLPEPLGQRAQAHVKARKAARFACAVAAAATGLVADPVASAGLWAEATRWEGLGESIPGRGRAQGPEK
jgi:hypothetical protein